LLHRKIDWLENPECYRRGNENIVYQVTALIKAIVILAIIAIMIANLK